MLGEWKLLLRTGFGNVFPNGRWTLEAAGLIAEAINSKSAEDWELVAEYAADVPWDPRLAD